MSVAGQAVTGPYRGLTAFDESDVDALFFFGRELETEIVVANALASRLTVLYGPTGVGKTSLLRAGAVYALRRLAAHEPVAVAVIDSWTTDPVAAIEEAARAAFTETLGGDPGDAPGGLADRLDAWTAALGGELCLVLDQLEEFFLYHGEERGQGTLLSELPELVVRPGLRVNVVLGIRDDALAQVDVFKAGIPTLFANYLRLDHLDREAARAAILGPLGRYNELVSNGERADIEPALVEAILDQVAAGQIEPGIAGRGTVGADANRDGRIETPYLQLVLQRLWEVERERGSSQLRLTTLHELGGAEQIVEDHLGRALDGLDPPQQSVAASMFDHLVTPSGTKIAHRLSDLATFARVSETDLGPILRLLAHERILRPLGENGDAGDRYEIYHDVLASAVLAWSARHESEVALERERRESRRRQRRLLAVAMTAFVALALMAALTIYAFSQRSDAISAKRRAQTGALLATALSQLDVDPVRSLQDALGAARMVPSGAAERALRRTLLALHARRVLHAGGPAVEAAYSADGTRLALADRAGQARIFAMPAGKLLRTLRTASPLEAVAFSPDGQSVATAARDGEIRISSVGSGVLGRTLSLGNAATSVAFSPDGRLIAAGGGRRARVWDAFTGALLHTLPHPRAVRSVSFSPDGALFMTVANDPTARVFDARTGKLVSILSQRGDVTAAAFGARGKLVVTGSRDGTARVWDPRSGALRATLNAQDSLVSVAFSPAGDLVATGDHDGTTRVWTVAGSLEDEFQSASAVVSVAFAPDGETLVSANSDGTATVWGTKQEAIELVGQRGGMRMAAFSPDGNSVVTVAGTTARLWDPSGERLLRRVHRFTAPASAVAFDHSGTLVASGAANGALLVQPLDGGSAAALSIGAPVVSINWADDGLLLAAGRDGVLHLYAKGRSPLRALATGAPIVAAALRQDGRVAATVGTNGVVRLWAIPSGSQIGELHPTGGAAAVALDPAGKLVATASGRSALLFDAHTRRLVGRLSGHTDVVTSVAFSRDGRQLVTASRDHDGRIWNVPSRSLVKVLHGHTAFLSGASFSADGRWVVTAGPLKAGVWEVGKSDLPRSFLFFLRGNQAPIAGATFSPVGWKIATAGQDGSVRVYDCRLCGRLPQLEALAQARLQGLRQQ
jgi:WD40 repeat protein